MEIWGGSRKQAPRIFNSQSPSRKYFPATPGLSQSQFYVDCLQFRVTHAQCTAETMFITRAVTRKASPWLGVREDKGQSPVLLIKKKTYLLIYFILSTYLMCAHMLWAMCGGQKAICGSSCSPSTMWSWGSGSGPQAWQETELSPIQILHIFRNI